MEKIKHRPNGFTLIELVISIGILAILAVFLLAALNPIEQFQKARDGQRKSDLTQVRRALEQYYQDHGSYPLNSGSYQMTDFNGTAVIWGGSTGWSPYMNLVPKDPSSDRKYVYYAVDASGTSGLAAKSPQKYYLYTSLERGPLDPQTCTATVATCVSNPNNVQYCNCTNVPVGADCGSSTAHHPCNFGVTSPNTAP